MNILLRCDIMKKICEMGERIERTLAEDQGSVDFGIAFSLPVSDVAGLAAKVELPAAEEE